MPDLKVRHVHCLAIACLGAALPARVTAQATDSLRKPRPQQLDSVVVRRAGPGKARYALPATTSGTKTFTPLRDIPQSISVITQPLIADQAMQGMADALRYVPGVTVAQGEGNRDQPVIRGNSTTAGFFLDGLRDDVQYFRDLYNVERVEVLKGSNALIFGRGTGGGVVNRVSRQADWSDRGEVTLQGGSFDAKRGTIDLDAGVTDALAVRVNGMLERSGSFRRRVRLDRSGIAPTATIAASATTRIVVGLEHVADDRTADRGLPSYLGVPAGGDLRTFFGDPDQSSARTRVDLVTLGLEHVMGRLLLRNRSRYGHYDKFYQNIFPGAVTADQSQVALNAYNNATGRQTLLNQTELVGEVATGRIRHTLLGGVELGRQVSDNFRNTGYFDDSASSILVPFAAPTVSHPVTFRQSATDADNHVRVTSVGVYVQDQVHLAPALDLIGGVRYERVAVAFHNNRTGQDLSRDDDLISPRAGLVVKPVGTLSFYGSYGTSYLPSSGDQFSSLTATSATLRPEKFTTYELGAKWDARPGLALTGAVYRLDRTNTTAPDPSNPAVTVQTGSQRTHGVELGAMGSVTERWQVMGGYGYQDAFVTSQTLAAALGATVPLVPRHTLSLWNRYALAGPLGVGLGVIHQSSMFAAIDNTVTLPAFTRVDAALFYQFGRRLRTQVNVENLLDTAYFVTANSNNNISPGWGRTLRVSLTAGF
jgi:catecholate siderophore receptor